MQEAKKADLIKDNYEKIVGYLVVREMTLEELKELYPQEDICEQLAKGDL